MDENRPATVVSTTLVLAFVAFLLAPSVGYASLEERLVATAVAGVAIALPIAIAMVYLLDGTDSHFFGPWGPESLVLLAVAAPVLAGTVWGAEAIGLTGVFYWIAVGVGFVVAVALGGAARAALFDDWPPSRPGRTNRDGGPPGGR